MSLDAPQIHEKAAAEVRLVSVDFSGKLDAGELLTGDPLVTVSPTGPTLSNEAVNESAVTILGVSVAAGQAVQFLFSGGTAGVTYTCAIAVGTDATPAQTLRGKVKVRVVAD